MSTEDISRILVPQRKTVQRSSSSSSLSSTASTSSDSTVTTTDGSSAANGEIIQPTKRKARGGFWSVSKSESTSSVSNARANGAVQPPSLLSGKAPIQPALPSQNMAQQNGVRNTNGVPSQESAAVLALLPMNGTFERKQITVPFFPENLRVGRQTNAKTVPTQQNGFFDSKVLSRSHAEVWAERNGKVWIRDVKSSNGTFVNGQRLSPENRDSEPHELRQHDTLELGIDIVSEDQKTIVHHKVSAKVEYVGLPGSSNNVLDLSFGDLDPSHSGSLLPSPMSQPMMHSRGRPGGPIINGRSTAPLSVAGNSNSSGTQSRQVNFWGAPLNVEQLVKSISVSRTSLWGKRAELLQIEMRAARQQASELENVGSFLHAAVNPEDSTLKEKEEQQPRHVNEKPKSTRTDHLARFADPPAPPPQQPLPEKPDSARSSPIHPHGLPALLRRGETARPTMSNGNSPTNPQNSHMLQLVEALSVAKKDLDSQAAKVQQLENMLNEERRARQDAEERAKRLEQTSISRPISIVEEEQSTLVAAKDPATTGEEASEPTTTQPDEQNLQRKLDNMVSDMRKMREDMDKFKRRAETAETDATKARESLAEMIERLRQENDSEQNRSLDEMSSSSNTSASPLSNENAVTLKGKGQTMSNGHVRPPKLPKQLEQAVATVLREGTDGNGEILAHSAPYVSMLGVVLIGVGLMAYLNSWQKTER